MIDFASAFPAPTPVEVAGQPVLLQYLTATEFAGYAAALAAAAWTSAKANEKAQGFTPVEWFRVKSEIDGCPRSIGDLIEAASTPEGARYYVVKALEKSGLTAEQAAAAFDLLDPFQQTELSLAVTRINKLKTAKIGGAAAVGAPLPSGGPTTPPSTATTAG